MNCFVDRRSPKWAHFCRYHINYIRMKKIVISFLIILSLVIIVLFLLAKHKTRHFNSPFSKYGATTKVLPAQRMMGLILHRLILMDRRLTKTGVWVHSTYYSQQTAPPLVKQRTKNRQRFRVAMDVRITTSLITNSINTLT